MKIAFTSKGPAWDSEIDPRFGRTRYLLVFDEETKELTSFDNQAVEDEAHGAGTKTSQKLFDLGADVLITGNGPGNTARSVLETSNVKIHTGAGDMTVREAYDAYRSNKLTEFSS